MTKLAEAHGEMQHRDVPQPGSDATEVVQQVMEPGSHHDERGKNRRPADYSVLVEPAVEAVLHPRREAAEPPVYLAVGARRPRLLQQ
jgi:hypothetical protein